MKNKATNILKTAAKAVIYPPKPLINYLIMISMIFLKALSIEKAKLFSKLFQHYFLQILKAKKEKRKAEIEINFAELGAVIEYLQTALKTAFIAIAIIYLVVGFFATSAISAILLLLHVPFQYVIAIQAPLSVIAIIYYAGLTVYILIKQVFTININQDFLKQQIFYETAYIYKKSCEIDKEVADMTVYQLTNSLLLHEKEKREAELKQIIGVEK